MSRQKRNLDKWRDAVLQHPDMSDACRVLLLVLADYMTADLRVSVDRKQLARRLNRSERALGRRFREAIGDTIPEDDHERADQRRHDLEHRLLDRIVRGQKNTTRSVYQGLMPDAVNRTDVGPEEKTFQQDTSKPVENDQKCLVENPPSRANRASPDSLPDTRGSCLLSDQPSASSHDRQKRSNDEAQPHQADAYLTGCRWHDDEHPCPQDCRNHPTNREATA